jgi:protein-L-isoaspartate(D-aspartate) O-methyltransferase
VALSEEPQRQAALQEDRIRRERMVTRLRDDGKIRDERVLEAMRVVPRHRFVPDALQGKAYGDHALPIGLGQTISQPWIVARLAELVCLQPEDAALEIGSGSGYQAAVLSRLCARVFTVERIPELSEGARRAVRGIGIENIHFKVFDGTYGWSEFAPYAAVVVTAACPEVPAPLLEQLAPGGRLVVPVGEVRRQTLRVISRARSGALTTQDAGPAVFVPLVGRFGFPA